MKILQAGWLLPFLSVTVAGCSKAMMYAPDAAVAAPPETAVPALERYASDGATAAAVVSPSNTRLAGDVDTVRPAGGRILIYSAQLQVSAADVEAALEASRKLCEEVGGYMESLSSSSIRIRVPAGRFNEVLDRIRSIGSVLSRTISAEDVTDTYVDLQLRLKNAQALRDRLLAILEKAQTVKDTLDIERELNRVREEIERLEGRLAAMEKQVAFSTILINFVLPVQVQAERRLPPAPFAWLEQLGVEQVLRLRE